LNVARRSDLRDGLRKSVVERNCPSLSALTADRNRGGHTVQEFAQILKKDNRFERNVQDIVRKLKQMLVDEHKDLVERKQFMDAALKWRGFKDYEAEAVRRVYRELYGGI